MKLCRRCDKTLPLSEYYGDSSRKDGIAAYCKACNRSYSRAAQTRYRTRSPERAKAAKKAWDIKNRPYYTAHLAKSRAAKLQRTPTWANEAAIAAFYKDCPAGHHVDHIVPLNGKTVSGLHVLGNLQYLPATENLVKGNSF